MAKTLFLLRHAKSDWHTPGQTDEERTLNERGERDAPRMGDALKAAGHIPDRILSSSAVRAQMTAKLVAQHCNYVDAPDVLDRLYLADTSDFMEVLHNLDEADSSVLVVAHNPGVAYFIEALTGESVDVPTATLAHIQLNCDSWKDLGANGAYELVQVWRPKEL